MKIAVMSDKNSVFGTVPDCFEQSPVLLIWDTGKAGVCSVLENAPVGEVVEEIRAQDCEAVVTGPHIGKEAFNPLADACITRYNGAGKKVHEAVRGGIDGSLKLIFEYEGGPGCQSGHGECEDGHCG